MVNLYRMDVYDSEVSDVLSSYQKAMLSLNVVERIGYKDVELHEHSM